MKSRFFATAIFLFVTSSAFGASGGAAVVDKVLASIKDVNSWDAFAVSNGGHFIATFDTTTFSEAGAIARLEKELSNDKNECQYVTSSGLSVWDDLLKTEEEFTFEEPQGLRTLKKLKAADHTFFIASRSWDGASGDSEYCQKFNYAVYFKNGKALVINYDITD